VNYIGETPAGATFSDDRIYRYSLWRNWESSPKRDLVAFIGLNPSTADEVKNDPTVTRCIRFSQYWGYGAMAMLNVFAYRATDPENMKAQPDPVGPLNDAAIAAVCSCAARVVCCWGNHGLHKGRAKQVWSLLQNLPPAQIRCFGLTKLGQPKHPLYLNRRTQTLKLVLPDL